MGEGDSGFLTFGRPQAHRPAGRAADDAPPGAGGWIGDGCPLDPSAG
jgi:hypothetical protein